MHHPTIDVALAVAALRIQYTRHLRALLLLVISVCPAASAASDSFATCRRAYSLRPNEYASSRCFFETAARSGSWREAESALTEIQSQAPGNPWIELTLANVQQNQGNEQAAEQRYRDAASHFAARRIALGEVMARANLRVLMFNAGRKADAAEQIARLITMLQSTELKAQAAQSTPSPSGNNAEVEVRILVAYARHLTETGEDLGHAYRLLRRAGAHLLPAHSYWLRREVFNALGSVCVALGRFDEAIVQFQTLQLEAAAQQDLGVMAIAKFNLADTLVEEGYDWVRPAAHAQAMTLAQESLRLATVVGNADSRAFAYRLLAELSLAEHPVDAAKYLSACIKEAQAIGSLATLSDCQWIEARRLAFSDGKAASATIDHAIQLVESLDNAPYLAHAFRHRMRISAHALPASTAIAQGLESLSAIEALRDLQPLGEGRAETLSAWTRDYLWLAGFSLQQQIPDAANAFAVMERMRARSLTEWLNRDERIPPTAMKRHREVLQQIVALQRALPLSTAEEQKARRAALVRLEDQELDLRATMYSSQLPVIRTATLAATQSALHDDEAILSFQFGNERDLLGDFGGGAWLTLVTHKAAHVYRLPNRGLIAQRAAAFAALLRRGEPLPRAAAVALHEDLFDAALQRMPASIDRLIIIADDVLGSLPVATLVSARDDTALGQRYQLDVIPSATWWLSVRNSSQPARAHNDALVFANPTAMPTWRDSTMTPQRFPPLTHARAEGRRVVAAFSGNSALLYGDDASEHALKKTPLGALAMLHFATHAVLDDLQSERSAVLLAAGSDTEDGLLQPREIMDLHLRGVAVVLASCNSASGGLIRGEGVMSLARAFFASGARVVVGSLWPMRDDHAEAFFKSFYARLAMGDAVSEAARVARRDLMDHGYPPQAWAGLVVFGDGTLAPLSAHKQPAQKQSAQKQPAHRGSMSNALALVGLFFLTVALLFMIALWKQSVLSRGAASASVHE